jgi:hypothetical protein
VQRICVKDRVAVSSGLEKFMIARWIFGHFLPFFNEDATMAGNGRQ